MDKPIKNVLVLGIGNLLNHDEGFGVHAIRQLQPDYEDIPGVSLLDGGTLGLNLLPLVDDATHLLILDAVEARREPGTIVELEGERIPKYAGVNKMSEHQLSFQEVLGLALLRGTLPEHLILIGVQPADLTLGIGLSSVTQAVLPDVLNRARRVLRGWGVQMKEVIQFS